MIKLTSLFVSIFLLVSCGSPITQSSFDEKVRESCPLIKEAWKTYKERPLNAQNLDILAASWYLVQQDLKEFAESDPKYAVFLQGAEDAFDGNYDSGNLNELLVFCKINQ